MEGKHPPAYKNAAFDKGLGINPVTNIMEQKLRAELNHTPGGCEDPSHSANPPLWQQACFYILLILYAWVEEFASLSKQHDQHFSWGRGQLELS